MPGAIATRGFYQCSGPARALRRAGVANSDNGCMRDHQTVVLALLTACSPTTGPDPVVVSGTWGGEHAVLTVGSTSATIEFDCAHGTMPAPLTLSQGTFAVTGDYVQEHGGPIRSDEIAVRQPAHQSGAVVGRTMTVRVRLTAPAQDLGPFTLTLGSSGRVFKCL